MKETFSIAFWGATGTTTGSRHLVSWNGKSVLLDCGLYQGRRKIARERNKNFGFDTGKVHCALLSHAHIDHSGNLPNLTSQDFRGPVYATPATEDLCRIMLRDSAYIQEKDAAWLNRRYKRRKKGKELIEPLYTMGDAEKCLQQFRAIPYNCAFEPAPGIESRFRDAGHILGAASIVLDMDGDGQTRRLVFSGDIGRVGLPLLRDPLIPDNVDWLIMEGTYGCRGHDPIGDAKEELRRTVEKVAARGGKIIVPSFSVERTQEIVYFLNELHNEGALPPIPVFVDSPLAINATEIFRLHYECFDKEFQKTLLADDNPFGFTGLKYTRETQESKKLNNISFPCMIISASGMCEAGRILHHLRNSIEDSKNCVMFVGYQAEGTLGRKIVERQEEVNIFGEPHRLRAEVVTLNTMSGHADKDELFNYARTVKETSPNLKKIFLVHGEQKGLDTLGARIRDELKVEVTIPELGDCHSL